jgi:pilus assembly protein CpaE
VLKAMEAAESRRLSQSGVTLAAPAHGTVVTVFGAKGGIGKSTVATNLAVALARKQTGSVVIVDLDNGFGDVGGMLDVRAERTLLDLANDIERVEKDDLRKYVVSHSSGLDVLAGPTVLDWRKVEPDQIRRVVDLLVRSYDTVVLDTSGMLSELCVTAIELATIVLWVTTTEFASVKDSLEALRALRQLNYSEERIRIVTNSITGEESVRPSAVSEAFQRDVFWSIPFDRKVRQGTHLGAPIVLTSPQSLAAKSITDLATLIAGGRVEQGKKVFGGFKWRPGVPAATAAD